MLDGVETVRAFSAQSRMRQLNFSRINRFGEAWVCLMGINRWLGIRLDVLASLILCSIALVAIHSRASLSSALIGMLVGYGVTMTGNLNRLVRTALDAEQDFSSVERLLEYSELPLEDGSSTVENLSGNARFGSVGAVEFQSVSARYRPGLDLVVKDLSFTLRPCEKLGICGRTGAGKSSMLSLLFRLIGCSSGRILIDGVNIASVPLETLRQSLSIVPQEPILFDGTLRFNLDPRGLFSDDRIWSALDRARLTDTVQRLPGQLETQICESGSSFSAGERQLLCMARALLSPARILVLDEATSSVDFATDAAIQLMIRSEFQDRTVLTIAHRLQTITWMDRVLVLDRGQIVEFDTPSNLQSQNGVFSAMLNELN
jgi:ABC-type multidrug transport system fused ATPase/permease subunit